MYKTVILDDNRDYIEILKEMLKSYHSREKLEVYGFSSCREFVESPLLTRADILLADIELEGEKNGIALVRESINTQRTRVIYITGHVEYCTKVYETDHIYFLTKPVRNEDLFNALDKAIRDISSCRDALHSDRISIKNGSGIVSIDPDKVLYAESNKRKLTIRMTDGIIETYMTVSEFLGCVHDDFLQCHKSFVVNMNHIKKFSSTGIVLDSGDSVPVSRNRKISAKNAYLDFLAERLQ